MDISDDEHDSRTSENDSGSDINAERAIVKRLGFADDDAPTHVPSVFDVYFSQATRASRTSSNVFSQLVAPLTAEEYHTAIRGLQPNARLNDACIRLAAEHEQYFPAFLAELTTGFNLIFYGYGSKRKLLNLFARQCTSKGHVIVANGFFANCTLKSFLESMAQLIDAPEIPGLSSQPESLCRRILARYAQKPQTRHFFAFIHNIDGPSFKNSRAQHYLAALAAHPAIHIVASIDHIAAPLLWSSTDLYSSSSASDPLETLPQGGFNWVWHDLTTMQPYDFEFAYADRTSYAGASASQRGDKSIGTSGAPSGPVSENAAKHVLASVTQKAKRLFVLLCKRQCASHDAVAAESGSTASIMPGPQHATGYDILFSAARDDFIATNDTAMRALLAEFRDHGLIVSSYTMEGESLWIPLPKEALMRLADSMQ